MAPPLPIPLRFRAGLLVKGGFLLGLGFLFFALVSRLWTRPDAWLVTQLVGTVVFAVCGAFLVSVSRLAFFDALFGEAERHDGAVALPSRRNGNSFRLADGRLAEFLLWNTWAPLTPGQRYGLVVGRRSLVLVAPPQLQAPAEPPAAA